MTAGGQTTSFTHDGDGALVKKVAGGQTTVYVGNYYEKQGTAVIKYYYFAGQRVAMRTGSTLSYLAGDHPSATLRAGLGTTSLTWNSSGVKVAEARHLPYGGERWTSGTLPTDYRFTGQRLTASLGLYQMGARWFDPYLNRFVQPDSIIPDLANPQSLNRYSYVLANPLSFVDPSGHAAILPPFFGNPISFEPHKLGSTGVDLLDSIGQAAINAGCGFLFGVCKVEGEVGDAWLKPGSDAEFIAAVASTQIMGFVAADVSFGMSSAALGASRESQVAEIFGDDVIGRNIQVEIKGFRSGEVDVVKAGGKFIEVGGPSKNLRPSDFGNQMKFLTTLAELEQGDAFFYYAADAPEWVINKAIEWLGEDHVIPITTP